MILYACGSCGQTLYFENVECTGCGNRLGYLPKLDRIAALESKGDDLWKPVLRNAGSSLYRLCANYAGHGVCNWMVPGADEIRIAWPVD